MINSILIAMPYFVSFMAEGAAALLLIIGIIAVLVKFRKPRAEKNQAVADGAYTASVAIPFETGGTGYMPGYSVYGVEVAAADVQQPEEDIVLKNGLVVPKGHAGIKIRYYKSFKARLIQSDDLTKENYAEIMNYLLSFKGIKMRMSWHYDAINYGTEKFAKLSLSGKTLCLCLALNPVNFFNTKYNVADVSDVQKYEGVPMMFGIRSKRSLAYAKELIDLTANKFAMTKLPVPCDKFKAQDFTYNTTEQLIDRRLIKVRLLQRIDGSAEDEDSYDADETPA